MRVFVAGATGAIGTQLVPQLVAAGHDVIGMTRSPARTDALRTLGARPVVADALVTPAAGIRQAAADLVDTIGPAAGAVLDAVRGRVQGETDPLIPEELQGAFAASLRSGGTEVDYRSYPGLDHGGVVADASPAVPELLNWTAARFGAGR